MTLHCPNTYRREIHYGEALSWEPVGGADSFQAWARDHAGPGSRWIAAGGYDIAVNAAIEAVKTIPDIVITAEGLSLPWATIDRICALNVSVDIAPDIPVDGERFTTLPAREPLQVISYCDGKAIRIDRFRFPVEAASPIETIIEQDRKYLHELLKMRVETVLTGGKRIISDGDGATETYASVETIDRRVAEVRARIAWFETAAAGDPMPRNEYW